MFVVTREKANDLAAERGCIQPKTLRLIAFIGEALNSPYSRSSRAPRGITCRIAKPRTSMPVLSVFYIYINPRDLNLRQCHMRSIDRLTNLLRIRSSDFNFDRVSL